MIKKKIKIKMKIIKIKIKIKNRENSVTISTLQPITDELMSQTITLIK